MDSTTGAESRNRDRRSLRGQFFWAPEEDFSLRFIADYAKADESCCDAVVVMETHPGIVATYHRARP